MLLDLRLAASRFRWTVRHLPDSSEIHYPLRNNNNIQSSRLVAPFHSPPHTCRPNTLLISFINAFIIMAEASHRLPRTHAKGLTRFHYGRRADIASVVMPCPNISSFHYPICNVPSAFFFYRRTSRTGRLGTCGLGLNSYGSLLKTRRGVREEQEESRRSTGGGQDLVGAESFRLTPWHAGSSLKRPFFFSYSLVLCFLSGVLCIVPTLQEGGERNQRQQRQQRQQRVGSDAYKWGWTSG